LRSSEFKCFVCDNEEYDHTSNSWFPSGRVLIMKSAMPYKHVFATKMSNGLSSSWRKFHSENQCLS
jgi:hypothetical protein